MVSRMFEDEVLSLDGLPTAEPRAFRLTPKLGVTFDFCRAYANSKGTLSDVMLFPPGQLHLLGITDRHLIIKYSLLDGRDLVWRIGVDAVSEGCTERKCQCHSWCKCEEIEYPENVVPKSMPTMMRSLIKGGAMSIPTGSRYRKMSRYENRQKRR